MSFVLLKTIKAASSAALCFNHVEAELSAGSRHIPSRKILHIDCVLVRGEPREIWNGREARWGVTGGVERQDVVCMD